MDLNTILQTALKLRASDVHLKVGLPPILRVDGNLAPLREAERLGPEALTAFVNQVMTEPRMRERFEQAHEIDLAYSVAGMGRFRINIFQQRSTYAMVMRAIPVTVPNIKDLNLPPVVEKISAERRGLVLVTGTTGSGKSTTLASMIDYINTSRTCHIVTIEDPIEFLHRDKRSIINQREIGIDTHSFPTALKMALRQDPNVILVGEMRDIETIETALLAAETGHLVMSTLHTVDATETINRIVTVFPPHQQHHVRLQLAAVLKGVISQRLVPRADGGGRVPAVEVLVATARIRDCIANPEKTREIPAAIAAGVSSYGMQTFDQSLMFLLSKGFITYEEALKQCTNRDDFLLKLKGISSTSDLKWDAFERGEGEEEQPGGEPPSVEVERF
ncbi:MAG: type IV pilus twitching motility protein PilT [Deltaproteobacteria bacterium]|nr:type IV pilus twitching motility protein PilT [Deltaproteobacteria bacterium]MBI3079076.1 type IV pilus twitching motility protein PilT [Deltaproteobacteria bacterium]